MDFSSTSQPSAAAEPATLFVAMELSKSSWLVAMHSPVIDKVSQHHIHSGDIEELFALIERKRTHAHAKLGRPVRIVSCYEAGYDGFRLHRLLQARGIDNRVLDASSILVDRRARRAKSDRLDLAGLLRTLMALERGESRVCRVVCVPSVEQEDARRRSRERERLVNERCQHSNRIKGLLMLHGIRDFDPTRPDWLERLNRMRTAGGQTLPGCLQAEILRECRRLWQVIEMIAEVEAQQRQAMQQQTGTAAFLFRVKGIGPTVASVLADEVFFRDFKNRRELGAYLGLATSPWRSGSMVRDQGIGKAGNPRARRIAVELAWLWLRHQRNSALAQWFHARVGVMKGRLRRIMLVAMARKLMVALWRYLREGLVPIGATLKA